MPARRMISPATIDAHPIFQCILRRDIWGNYLALCPVVGCWCAMDEEDFSPKLIKRGLSIIISTKLHETAWDLRN